MRNLMLLIGLMIAAVANAQTPILGDWVTVDDATGKQMSIVNIYQGSNGLYYGKITSLFEDPNALCVECTGADHKKPIVGLIIIRDMQLKDGELRGGKVLDPDNGKFYYAKAYIKDGNLILRGSLDKAGLLGRSQTWIRKK